MSPICPRQLDEIDLSAIIGSVFVGFCCLSRDLWSQSARRLSLLLQADRPECEIPSGSAGGPRFRHFNHFPFRIHGMICSADVRSLK